ncbi:uncharacterized protein M421DRAFT_416739 [Didymella exigua CBS 183.55]|uniref:Uncharacterized protein n=1 Tax=Didymella exigua CBS 183.55 TaxID=1150837 RepID=A0A6A5RU99_9PLEO|nr:uncharacterized protein M421DRAFT_416739 [Didymella exigua CBS 183.55]KAF1932011.1 hypothetical protein M421DRAFT_416739 [Didymella exigua CBS 183.55]
MLCKTILLAGALALGTFAAPIPDCPEKENSYTAPSTDNKTVTGSVTADQLTQIAPEAASCSGAPFPEECADATAAATALNKSFDTYGIKTAGEKAALIAYTLFESGNYKYSKNHFPGRPGQGTRMMAMPPFIAKYATAVAGAEAVTTANAVGGDAGLDAVLALVNSDDEKSFGSAAWFYSTQCQEDVKAGVAAETIEGWHNFLTACVGTTLDETRDTPWVTAKAVILA